MYNLKRDFNTQIILACDEQGKFTEYIPRSLGHTGKGRRHLAITVLLYNKKGEVLLQKRKHKVFDDIWDFTAATHPIHRLDGTDETFEEATLRCLEDEYGITDVKLKNLGAFNYFNSYGELCENEHCMLLIGEYDGKFKLNPQAGYGYKWMDKLELFSDIEKNPHKYSPWAVKGASILKRLKAI